MDLYLETKTLRSLDWTPDLQQSRSVAARLFARWEMSTLDVSKFSGCPPAEGCTPELTDGWYIAYPTIFATLYHRRASCLIQTQIGGKSSGNHSSITESWIGTPQIGRDEDRGGMEIF
jgi:hypothetical protein